MKNWSKISTNEVNMFNHMLCDAFNANGLSVSLSRSQQESEALVEV